MLKRVLIILHLCIACSLLLYFLGFPFFGTHYFYRSNLLVVEAAIDEKDGKGVFNSFPPSTKELILSKKSLFESGLKQSFAEQARSALQIVPEVGVPLWLWLFLSFYLSVKLLKGSLAKGSALFLLPLLALILAVHNFTYGTKDPLEKLFPTESELLKGQKAVGSMSEQMEILKKSWDEYLVETWGKPGEGAAIAEQRFQIAWARLLPTNPYHGFSLRRSLLLLTAFFGWNLLFSLLTCNQVKDDAGKKSDCSA